jgi:NAD-dependent SIR2 family protein deacetylase
MKFSAPGPDIPSELIEASLRGEVVFIVGAGASRPADLPDFRELTERWCDLQRLQHHEQTYYRWRQEYGGLKLD